VGHWTEPTGSTDQVGKKKTRLIDWPGPNPEILLFTS